MSNTQTTDYRRKRSATVEEEREPNLLDFYFIFLGDQKFVRIVVGTTGIFV